MDHQNLKLWKLFFFLEWRGNVNNVQGHNSTSCLVEKHWIDAVWWVHLMNWWPSWWIVLIWNIMTFLHLTCGFNHRWRWGLDCRSVYLQLTCGFNHSWSWVEMMFKRANMAKMIILRLVGNQRSHLWVVWLTMCLSLFETSMIVAFWGDCLILLILKKQNKNEKNDEGQVSSFENDGMNTNENEKKKWNEWCLNFLESDCHLVEDLLTD